MSKPIFGQRIIHLESVDSTNNYAAKVFKSGQAPPGTVILADIQNNGRGQREKTWQSDAFQNLTFSLTADIKLWKINSLIDLNRLIAISLFRFFKQLNLSPKIKWPNDIMISDKKICGILIENYFRDGSPKTIIGIGINVNQKTFDVPRATSLIKETRKQIAPRDLLDKYIHVLNDTFLSLPIHDSERIHNEYDQLLWKLETPHQFKGVHGNSFEGLIQGTSLTGELKVYNGTNITNYRNGEVSY